MKEILEYATSGFWVFIGSISIIYIVLFFITNAVIMILSRLFRTINIAFRGYPPSHLDADGDFKPYKK